MAVIAPDTLLLNWLLALPFFGALCVALFPRFALRVSSEREAAALPGAPLVLGALVCVMAVALAVSLVPLTLGGEPVPADYWWTRDLYHLRFEANAFSALVVLVLHTLGLLVHLHLAGLPRVEDAHRRGALLLAAQGCGAAATLSADVVLLVFFVEAAVVALWLFASLDSPRTAERLLMTAHVGGLLLLVGVLVMWQKAGDSSLSALPLLLFSASPASLRTIGLLILLGLLPLLAAVPGHGWLSGLARGSPAALAAAVLLPPVGGAVILKLLPGSLAMPLVHSLAGLGFALGIATLWWGALRAWLAKGLLELAVWLTVAHSGYLLIALAAAATAAGSPRLVQGAALHLVLTPLALVALWSAAAAAAACVGTDGLAGLSGLFSRLPLAGIALLCGGLSLAGLPPLAGFQPQRLLLSALLDAGRHWTVVAVLFADLLIVVALLDAFRRAFLRGQAPPLRWTSGWLSVPLIVSTLALLAIGIWSGPLLRWGELVSREVLSISP